MSYQGILESSLKVDGTKIGLGDSKPEQVEFPARLLGGESLSADECEVTIELTDDRQPELAVISADTYELKYTNTVGPDKEKTTFVEYQPEGSAGWTPLKSAHVFKRRKGIDLSNLKKVKFRVEAAAVKEQPVKVEVYVGVSKEKEAAKKTGG